MLGRRAYLEWPCYRPECAGGVRRVTPVAVVTDFAGGVRAGTMTKPQVRGVRRADFSFAPGCVLSFSSPHGQPRASGGMADALASGASVLRDVGVQVPLRPQRAVRYGSPEEVGLQKCNPTSSFSVRHIVGGGFRRTTRPGNDDRGSDRRRPPHPRRRRDPASAHPLFGTDRARQRCRPASTQPSNRSTRMWPGVWEQQDHRVPRERVCGNVRHRRSLDTPPRCARWLLDKPGRAVAAGVVCSVGLGGRSLRGLCAR